MGGADREALAALGHQLAMHVVALKPPYVSRSEGVVARVGFCVRANPNLQQSCVVGNIGTRTDGQVSSRAVRTAAMGCLT